MKKTYAYVLGSLIAVLPLVAQAQTNKKLSDIIALIMGYFNTILFLLLGFAVIAFVYYVIKYFILSNDNRAEAGSYVLYSVIGFFVILSLWGIVNILQNTFGLQNENNRPASWTSFSNLFPGGSSSSGSNSSGFNSGANGFSGSSYDPEGSLRYDNTQSSSYSGSSQPNAVGNDPESSLRSPDTSSGTRFDSEAGLNVPN